MLKAIPTEYDGHRFRSRLEARWALFFNFIGIPWEFEREAFSLVADGKPTGFTPDFWLPSLRIWFEVKPELSSMHHDQALALVGKVDAFLGSADRELVLAFGALRDEDMVRLRENAAQGFSVRWGRCAECLAWDLGAPDSEERTCGHAAGLIGRQQASGALLDSHAHRFWEPR